MQVFRDIAALRHWRRSVPTLAFAPTMGNLHQGHLDLLALGRQHAEQVAASIFVNRLQFGPSEDFDSYPRTLEADLEKLSAAGADAVFVPDEGVLYPQPQRFNVEPPAELASIWCGAVRPGHFRGVATVVCKLLNIMQADVAVFGKKDYQQLTLIRGMVADLNLPVDIIGCETRREADGLAKSSRNGYLSAEQRREAPRLYGQLQAVAQRLSQGVADYRQLEQEASAHLAHYGWQVDYVSICDREQLLPLVNGRNRSHAVVLAAARLGTTRLIDNLEV